MTRFAALVVALLLAVAAGTAAAEASTDVGGAGVSTGSTTGDPSTTGDRSTADGKPLAGKVVVIDPGHQPPGPLGAVRR